MSFIKAKFQSDAIEILNLRHIECINIDEDSINLICVEGNEYCYFNDPRSQFYIVNFDEVKEKLLKLCDD